MSKLTHFHNHLLSSVPIPQGKFSGLRRFLAFAGPGYMVAVGYMDPGNWATDIQGGAQFGYTLLFVILLSNLMAVLLQALAARLGIATGKDLAQACREWCPPWLNLFLWLACELAIIACDLAEVIGTAIALNLLFSLPLLVGTLISVLDTFLVLLLMKFGFRSLEAFVITLLVIIGACFTAQLIMSAPSLKAILTGFLPSSQIITNASMLYIAIGIVGATVMPHNLYLHSSLVQTRAYERTQAGKKEAIRWATWDGTIALTFALGINAAILIVSATAFHNTIYQNIAEISDAWRLLSPVLGFGLASTLFAIALLAAGTNSTVTGTLAGQIIMEGFLHIRLPYWARRLITRGLAILPVIFVIALYGSQKISSLLIFSQIILSMQLPFAVIPLVLFVSSKKKMEGFSLSPFWVGTSWLVTVLIIVLNIKLLIDSFS